MEKREYMVIQIDGDYAQLREISAENNELKLVARALLPIDIYEGCKLIYECFEYCLSEE